MLFYKGEGAIGKFVKRKRLLPEQYKRANRTMCNILTVCYILYIIVEINHMSALESKGAAIFRCALYFATIVVMQAVNVFKGNKKSAMVFMACTFLIMYAVLVMDNRFICMVLVFPALIALGFLVCIYGSYKAVALLVDFSKEDQSVIEKAAEHREKVAVVADEIRELAEETKTSTEMITEIMNELIKVTKKTQVGIEESAKNIDTQRKKVKEVNASFTEVEDEMFTLKTGVDSMSHEAEDVLEANKMIVDSISQVSSASEEVSAGSQLCKESIDGIFDKLNDFSKTVESTFEQLQILKDTANVQ